MIPRGALFFFGKDLVAMVLFLFLVVFTAGYFVLRHMLYARVAVMSAQVRRMVQEKEHAEREALPVSGVLFTLDVPLDDEKAFGCFDASSYLSGRIASDGAFRAALEDALVPVRHNRCLWDGYFYTGMGYTEEESFRNWKAWGSRIPYWLYSDVEDDILRHMSPDMVFDSGVKVVWRFGDRSCFDVFLSDRLIDLLDGCQSDGDAGTVPALA